MAQLAHDPLRPRSADASARGGLLALLAHLLLVGALSLSVNWHIKVPEGGEAELWSNIPKAAAPAPEPIPQPPEPVKPPEPTPQPTPEPPKPVEPEPEPPRPAQIAEKKVPPPKPVKPKPEPKPVPKPEPKPVKVEPKPTKPVPAEPPQSTLKSDREKNLQRMLAGVGGSDELSGNPNVGHGPSLSKGYGAKVAAAIKRNLIFPDSINGNPVAVVSVRCSPNGQIISRKVVQSSGVQAWDEAVLRAIDRTGTVPLDENGGVPSTMEIEFRPRDL